MQPSFKDAVTICKSVMRNGFDAHIVNTPLQHKLIEALGLYEIDLATDAPFEELNKIFPALTRDPVHHYPALLGLMEENGCVYRFYLMNMAEATQPETCLTRLTPTMLLRLAGIGPVPRTLVSGMSGLSAPNEDAANAGFADFSDGVIRLEGLPDESLRSNYLLGIRAFRYAANYELPIEPNTWMSIVRAAQRILDYVPIQHIMDEWRKVDAENMWKFVQMLFDSQIMHGILPEIAGLSRVRQTRNDSGQDENVLKHTIETVRRYPEGEFHHDWYGTFAMLFHDVGKLYTAEFYEGRWTFYEHHRVGAKVTRKILRRLHMLPEDIDLICHLVRNHMRFSFMMTDKGIRRFKAQDEYPRLIEMSRANIKAREDNYTAFNHNTKYLERAEMPEQMLEPLLNGNEIMICTGLKPGPMVGQIRNSLLTAQIAGEVTTRDEAMAFVKNMGEAQV
ncbi:HD domain-containing protein [Desulfovibrio sp. OttesenSCG-928-G11]|nr:HD domain-containing protein [Desulfovibrio sp. OttesenSCG-928-G11]